MKSVDGSCITSFFVHECDSSTRMGSRPRRFLFTGHQNGTVQVRHQYIISMECLPASLRVI